MEGSWAALCLLIAAWPPGHGAFARGGRSRPGQPFPPGVWADLGQELKFQILGDGITCVVLHEWW